ncbi:putative cysteine alpha-hairpin motif superfamily [Dioscorea sansibarensis]
MGSAGGSPTPPQPPPAAAVLHQSEADEEDENVKQLHECSTIYLALQECLAQTNRNWKSCQPEVQALKECHMRRNNKRSN